MEENKESRALKELSLGRILPVYFNLKEGSDQLEKYKIVVVDTSDPQILLQSTCAIVIVPKGKESKDVYSTEDGYRRLCEQIGHSRVAIVSRCEGNNDDFDTIKKSIEDMIELIVQKEVTNVIPYITEGEDKKEVVDEEIEIGKKYRCYKDGDPYDENEKDEFEKDYLIEDVLAKDGSYILRQIRFRGKLGEIQSDVKIRKKRRKGKKDWSNYAMVRSPIWPTTDREFLYIEQTLMNSEYLAAMIAGICPYYSAFEEKDKKEDSKADTDNKNKASDKAEKKEDTKQENKSGKTLDTKDNKKDADKEELKEESKEKAEKKIDKKFNSIILGTGAGILSMFVYKTMNPMFARLNTVDIDEEFVRLGRDYFGFNPEISPNFRSEYSNAVDYLEKYPLPGKVNIIDDPEDKTIPCKSMLSDRFINSIKRVLHPDLHVVSINTLGYTDEDRHNINKWIISHFKYVSYYTCEDTTNRVYTCSNSHAPNLTKGPENTIKQFVKKFCDPTNADSHNWIHDMDMYKILLSMKHEVANKAEVKIEEVKSSLLKLIPSLYQCIC